MNVYVELNNRHPAQCVETARLAEAMGFTGVTIPDHVFMFDDVGAYPYSGDGSPPFDLAAPWPDVWVLIGAMSAVTQRLRFRTAVYLLALRHPLIVARAVGTAACLAPGRIDLGVGVGWLRSEFDTLGVDYTQRGRLTDEAIHAVRSLLDGPGPVKHHGATWQLGPLHLEPAPATKVPVLGGGTSDAALRRAVTLTDGYLAPPLSVTDTLTLYERVRAARQREGTDRTSFVFHARPTGAHTPDVFRQLEDAGIDSVGVSLLASEAARSTELEDALRDIAERVGLGV